MKKGRRKGGPSPPGGLRGQEGVSKPNPFEMRSSSRKQPSFAVLGKRGGAGKKNLVQARQEGVEKRKKTLLVEYRQLRKANTFIDRRFGEDDPRLDEADKALARFQVQRLKQAKKAQRFALGAGDAELDDGAAMTLTHGGRSLEELEELVANPADLLGDDGGYDEELLQQLTAAYHFGGGGGGEQQHDGGDGDGDGDAPRRLSKKQIMEEIIAKSKAAKAEKARQKEADEAALQALDASLSDLLAAGRGEGARRGLASLFKAPGHDKGLKLKPESEADAEYDRAARELVFEAKGQAGERTLTAEELEEKEQARLAALEAARLARMRADARADGEAGEEEAGGEAAAAAALPRGGYAAKRARAKLEAERASKRQRHGMDASGDALDENFALSDDEDGSDDEQGDGSGSDGEQHGGAANALEARRQAAAAGSHPLQQAFRAVAAKLAAKHGAELPPGAEEGETDDEGEEGGSGSGSGSSEQGEGESDDEGAEDEAGQEQEQQQGSSDSGSDDSGSGGEQQEEQQLPHPSKRAKQLPPQQPQQPQQQQRKAGAPQLEGPLDLSFTPPVPASYADFERLVAGRPAEQLALAVQRIRAFNAAALAADSKRQLQVLYGILVQHFVMLAGQQPLPRGHLDVLTRVLLQLTPDVPIYAATVARARLARLHERLGAALADPLAAGPLLGWPGPRQLLQLRLFALLFPVSDRRHPVTTPLALLLGKWLSQAPVASAHQAGVGLLLAGMALANAAPAARFCPEVVCFLDSCLRAFVPAAPPPGATPGAAAAPAAAAAAAGVSLFTPGLLALSSCVATAGPAPPGKQQGGKKRRHKQQQEQPELQQQLPSLQLWKLLSTPAGEASAAKLDSDAFKLQLLGAAVATAGRVAQLSHGVGDAAPEVLQPLAAAAAAVAGLPGLPQPAADALRGLLDQLRAASDAVVAARQPMVQGPRAKLVPPREYNPRFEEGFSARADYDPDRQRSATRKLQRQLVKEKRGAMRELRRDAAFLAAERDADKARVDAERLASERSFYSELQAQEADAKSGGQRGMNPHKRKKK